MTTRRLFPGFRFAGVPLLLLFLGVGCGDGGGEADDLFLLAAEALSPEAYAGRPRVVNPFLISQGNPPMTKKVLSAFREAGLEIIGGTGEEDPTKATLYFSSPRLSEEGRYEIQVHVSLGARFGSRNRGDTWWRVVGECKEGCRVLEAIQTDSKPWS